MISGSPPSAARNAHGIVGGRTDEPGDMATVVVASCQSGRIVGVVVPKAVVDEPVSVVVHAIVARGLARVTPLVELQVGVRFVDARVHQLHDHRRVAARQRPSRRQADGPKVRGLVDGVARVGWHMLGVLRELGCHRVRHAQLLQAWVCARRRHGVHDRRGRRAALEREAPPAVQPEGCVPQPVCMAGVAEDARRQAARFGQSRQHNGHGPGSLFSVFVGAAELELQGWHNMARLQSGLP
jgi:hypothetical protein